MTWKAAALLAAMTACVAHAATLSPGQVLEVRFSSVGASCPGGPCDTLMFSAQPYGSWSVVGVSADLFDGTAFLGRFVSPVAGPAILRSATSIVGDSYPIADLNPLVAGTTNGIAYYRLNTGYYDWPGEPEPLVQLSRAQAPGFMVANGPLPITSVRIIDEASIPEPSSALLLAAGLLGCACIARSKRVHRPNV